MYNTLHISMFKLISNEQNNAVLVHLNQVVGSVCSVSFSSQNRLGLGDWLVNVKQSDQSDLGFYGDFRLFLVNNTW